VTVRELTLSYDPFEGKRELGDAGAYELVRGLARIGLDPDDPANARVVDLASAPRDAGGLVSAAADVVMLRPADPRRGNGTLLYTVANRGGVSLPLQPARVLGGAGLAAVRDMVSHLREREAFEHVIGFGVSQSGRFLRQFLHEGLNLDEAGRTVFDGVLCDRAGARRGEFNHRYALPAEAFAPGFGDLPPYAPGELLDRQRRAGGVPKLVQVNSSWEYWRGDAALGHVRTDGSAAAIASAMRLV
jgi:hypothetical protein